jgi:hypothetical protein
VLNGVISLSAARDLYGVVINPDTLELDGVATSKLRS